MIYHILKKNFVLLLALSFCLQTNPNLTYANTIEKLKKAAEVDPKDYAPHFCLLYTSDAADE